MSAYMLHDALVVFAERRIINMKKKICLICFLIVVIGILSVIVYSRKNTGIREKDFNNYITYDDKILKKESEYFNENGYVEKDDIPQLLSDVENIIKSGIKDGTIEEYVRDSDNNNIYIKFSSGINYLFIPFEKDKLSNGESGKILTVEPNASTYAVNMSYLMTFIDKYANDFEYKGSFQPTANANLVKTNYRDMYEYNDKYALKDKEITLDSLKKWGNNKIIIFEGHGGYNSKLHSCLSTGQSFFGFEDFSKYKEDIRTGNIVLSSFPQIGETGIPYSPVRKYLITSKFVENYFEEMDKSLIFLGACYSGKDDVLAKALLDKGADVVLGYTDTTSMEYEMMTRTMFFYALSYIGKENESYTVTQALNYAKNIVGLSDSFGKSDAKLVCFSKDKIEERYALDGIKETPLIVPILGKITEVSEYLENYVELVNKLNMKETDSWQFSDSNSYTVDNFYLEWKDNTFSMKNEGASNVELYGTNLGDSIDQANEVLQNNSWTCTFTSNEMQQYVTSIAGKPYLLNIYLTDRKIVSWYLNNWIEEERPIVVENSENTESNFDEDDTNKAVNDNVEYEYKSGELLSDFTITGNQAYLGFWHDYGRSSSDEDFIFEWIDGQNEYEVIGNRSGKKFKLTFEQNANEMQIVATCVEDEYYSLINAVYIKK